jgi:putative methanogenesis marker protein 5
MAIFGPLIEEAEAAIIMEDAPFGFGCIGCARTNELSMYFLRKRGIPVLELHYPDTREGTMEVVNQINAFLDSLEEKEKAKGED